MNFCFLTMRIARSSGKDNIRQGCFVQIYTTRHELIVLKIYHNKSQFPTKNQIQMFGCPCESGTNRFIIRVFVSIYFLLSDLTMQMSMERTYQSPVLQHLFRSLRLNNDTNAGTNKKIATYGNIEHTYQSSIPSSTLWGSWMILE